MARGRTALAVVVACVVAACGASPAPSAAPVPTSGDAVTGTPIPTASASPSLAATNPPPSAIPSPDPSSAAAPPKPSGVTFDEKRKGDEDPSTTEITQTVRWDGPRSDGVEIQVYGVTECLARPANPAPATSGPCLVEHTPLPASVRTLLATAPASDGAVSWTWTGTFDCEIGLAYDPDGPAYYALVLAAYGASDHSIFAIAAPGEWDEPGPDEIIC
jgi:hypothetical protein